MHEVSALVPGSEVVVVPDAGHSACFGKPDEFNRCVLDCIARRAG
jgi:pimeloyl-ACP methyl ester carboxylesterase